ncbi:MAG TPA: YCF48-related protein [Pirellulaceae bacterium]|nr:YCF48-related protein [Pirellulaceae bacterium]HMO92037.1 YCF48-related protein [Pirellulaceae bacterium]HMP68836.1 YCF48-related protein [Pirellulaceae bacterium]
MPTDRRTRIVKFAIFTWLVLCVSCPPGMVFSQEDNLWTMQQSTVTSSLRGLSVVDDRVVWASGTAGTVLRTVDGGATWGKLSIDAAALDFRAIHAMDESTCVVLSAGSPARVYRTEDSGQTWKLVFEHGNERAFFNAVAFKGDWGIGFSDPINGRFELIQTSDGGKSWSELPARYKPSCLDGEAGFAASGTCMRLFGERLWIGLGGQHEIGYARIIHTSLHDLTDWKEIRTPLTSGESSGVFSLAFADEKNMVAVGGDYKLPDQSSKNVVYSEDGGLTWQMVQDSPPSGYRSAVAFCSSPDREAIAVCVGPNGTDASFDFGKTWRRISDVGFHAIDFSHSGNAGWAVGSDGRIAKIKVDRLTSK